VAVTITKVPSSGRELAGEVEHHPGLRVYRRVGLDAVAGQIAAGRLQDVAARVLAGEVVIQRDEVLGWHGIVPDQEHLLERWMGDAAAEVWPAMQGPGLPEIFPSHDDLPAWSLSTSKGDPMGYDALFRGVPGALRSALPGQVGLAVARRLGVPVVLSCPVAAACSTGLYALLEVADAIEDRRAAQGLAGTADGALPPWLFAGFSAMGVLCGEHQPGTSVAGGPSMKGSGFAPAAGAAVVGLSDRLLVDGWRLLAGVRLGDAGHETHFVDPRTLATALAGLWAVAPEPEAIVCHATGTLAGDAYERGVLDVGPWREVPRWCFKPRIGHTLGASGLVELAIAMAAPVRRIWKLGLGFGGHLAAVALER
jgi:hypothetical protein